MAVSNGMLHFDPEPSQHEQTGRAGASPGKGAAGGRQAAQDKLARSKKLPYMQDMLELLHDIAQGVAYLHGRNIIHGGGWACACPLAFL